MKITITRYNNNTYWIQNEKRMVEYRLPNNDPNILHYNLVYHTAVQDAYLDTHHPVEVEDDGIIYTVYLDGTKTIMEYDLEYFR